MANEIKLKTIAFPIFGITDRRYRQMADEGIVPQPHNGDIDFVLATKLYVAHLRKLTEGEGSLTLTDWRTEKTKAEAELKKIELQRAKAEVRDVMEITQELSILFTNIKIHVRAWAKSLPPLLYGRGEKEIGILLGKEADRVLRELATIKVKRAGNGKK
jgi:hypothetical protein